MRPRPQVYTDLNSGNEGRDVVAWYWRIVALASSIIILGGYLILPVTFSKVEDLRASATALGVFAIALLTAGFVLTGLLCFAVRVPIFQVESVFTPALVSCIIGLLTVFWDFVVYNQQYKWNTRTLLVTIAGGISSVVYGFLVIYTYRKIHLARSNPTHGTVPLNDVSGDPDAGPWHPQTYYDNYNLNMYPTSARPATSTTVYNHNAITEEEMQRQQMLMLLLQREQPSAPGTAPGTFRIEWQSREEEDMTPVNGYYAPDQSPQMSTAYTGPPPSLTRRITSGLQVPWDGVWRVPMAASAALPPAVPTPSRHPRERRREEIEAGSVEYR